MRIIIHACPSRMWYVENFLSPALEAQGIDPGDVLVWNDEEGRGNLFSFAESCRYLGGFAGGTWHLQDDVVVSRDFAERARALEAEYPDKVICGFCFPVGNMEVNCRGRVPVPMMWWSFQCIYIPNALAGGFARWFLEDAQFWGRYREKVEDRKHDDWFFKEYMMFLHKDETVECVVPNLADHIDYLIGGTVLTPLRARKVNHGVYWAEPETVEALAKALEQYRKADSKQ